MLRTQLFLTILPPILSLLTSLPANAAGSVEYACGTKIAGGSFYSETGRMSCDEPGDKKEITTDSKSEVFCFYQAVCTPITMGIRNSLIAKANQSAAIKDWSDLDDDTVNQVVIKYMQNNGRREAEAGREIEFNEVAVQCVGSKTRNGNIDCPRVNECVNNRRNASLFWKIQPLNVKMSSSVEDSQGFRVRKTGSGVPKAVAPSGVAQ